MTGLLIGLYVFLFSLDIILVSTFRGLMFSFLLSKHNKKGAKKIHKSQSAINRFTFGYIKHHTLHPKEYKCFHGFYIVNLCFAPIQYLSLLITNILSLTTTVILLCIFCALKMFFNVVLFIQQNSERVFRFDKRY